MKKLFFSLSLITCLFLTGIKAQYSYGSIMDIGFLENTAIPRNQFNRLFITQQAGVRVKFQVKSFLWMNLKNYKEEIGFSIRNMAGIATNNEAFDFVRFELPIGISFNSDIMYLDDKEIILGMKYIPHYMLELKQFGDSFQFEIGMAFKMNSRLEKQRSIEFVLYQLFDTDNYRTNLGNRAYFRIYGVSVRANVLK